MLFCVGFYFPVLNRMIILTLNEERNKLEYETLISLNHMYTDSKNKYFQISKFWIYKS